MDYNAVKIETLSLGSLQNNCYLLHDNEKVIIIDPSDEAIFIAEKIFQKNLKSIAIIATHGHFDHILAAGELQALLKIPFYIHKRDEFLLKTMNQRARFFLKQKRDYSLPSDIKFLKKGFFDFNKCRLKIIETPGHTPGSLCIYLDPRRCAGISAPILFSGDTLFKNDIGRYDFSYSNKNQLKKSLELIFQLPKETIVYPGHGEPTTLLSSRQSVLRLLAHLL